MQPFNPPRKKKRVSERVRGVLVPPQKGMCPECGHKGETIVCYAPDCPMGSPRKAPNDRVFQTHRAFVKRHLCVIPKCNNRDVEFAHLRTAANSGMGMKPPDWYGIGLCSYHHKIAHSRGHATMAEENGVDLDYLFKTAAYLASKTPDKRMREAMKEKADA